MSRLTLLLVNLTVACAVAVVYTLSHRGEIEVCYDLYTQTGAITRIYWEAGTGFNETASAGRRAGPGFSEPCIRDPRMRASSQLRVDPVDLHTAFQLTEIRLQRLDLLQPWRRMFGTVLTPADSTARQQVEVAGDGFLASGTDPYFVWRIAPSMWSAKRVAAVNAASSMLLMALVTTIVLTVPGHRSVVSVWSAPVCLSLFAVCVAAAAFLRPLSDAWAHVDLALYLSFVLLAAYYVLARTTGAGLRAAGAMTVLAVVLLSILFDVAYRIGYIGHPAFARNSNDPYHWRLTRTADENRTHSSIRYYADFRRLRELLEPGAHFLSDLATSYYVNAALPLYPKVVQAHHSRHFRLYDEAMAQLCADGTAEQLGQALRAAVQKDKQLKQPPPRYVILNKDSINNNLRHHCLRERFADVTAKLELVADLRFQGRYLDVYELDYGQF